MTRYQAQAFRTSIGRRLRERRLELGMTQEALACEAGISQGSVSHYEQGKIEIPLGVLLELCDVLAVSPLMIVPGLLPHDSGADVAREARAS